jgi:hypothetical protein
MADVLLEDINPNGNVQAVVEVNEGTCYFYLFGKPDSDFGMRSLWVCNLAPAPAVLDVAGMHEGKPPMNPRAHCRNPAGRAAPHTEDLRVVWLPEGNGAALYEKGAIAAIIPPWSGRDGFCGYARECLGQGPLAWELETGNAQIARFETARSYWTAWEGENVWDSLRDGLCARIESALGPRSNYYAIDGGRWPPKALVRIPHAQGTALVTVGLCLRPQPNVEIYVEDTASVRRIELAALLPKDWPDEAVKGFAAYLSGQSNLPWEAFTWLGEGHTIPCDSWRQRKFVSAALVTQHPAVGQLALGEHFGDPVQTLWLLPLTAEQQARAEEDGTAAVLDGAVLGQWRDC